ncbi:hypothetical protein [Benzoatithermus flavus]|uniref:Uncharacterized protein n=1 Tax=Benzoatithermus flavus TaxID=3108223 RepID=A0ABU8XRP1_9PROT
MLLAIAWAVGMAAVLSGRGAGAAPVGYPTEALADYVFGCMATNGQTQEALHRCSCSIDHIADKLSYDEYVQAETVLRMQQVPGGDDRITMFRTSPWAQQMVDRLRQAQVEAEGKCF